MKATELPDDDELRRLIHLRYGDEVGLAAPPYVVSTVNFGTKLDAPWRWPALFAVNELRLEGVSLADALRAIYSDHDLDVVANITFASFRRSYEVFRGKELREHFRASVLCGEIDEAISALRLCRDAERQMIWSDLNRDSSHGPGG